MNFSLAVFFMRYHLNVILIKKLKNEFECSFFTIQFDIYIYIYIYIYTHTHPLNGV